MHKLLMVGLGGFLGAVARYELSGLAHRFYDGSFPLGTLIVNVLGCLAIGALVSLVEDRQMLSPNTRLFLQIGLLGAFTTFSTFGYETIESLEAGDVANAVWNVVANVTLGIAAVVAGRAAIRGLGV